MSAWLDQCRQKVLIIDGAMGTELQARGLAPGESPEKWARRHPMEVAEVHAAYVEAGADLILTCTFGANSFKLAAGGLADQTEAMNWALARIARDAAPKSVVLGDLGPTGEMIAPLGERTAEEIRDAFGRQVLGLADVVDGFIIETMSDVEEAVLALEAAKRLAPGKPVLVSLTYQRDAAGSNYHTMMGVDPAGAARRLTAAGADAIGANCGSGCDDMIAVVRLMAGETDRPLFAEPNAGLPKLVGGRTVFDESPEVFAAKALQLVAAGARLIGGCCGTTPRHIAALRLAVS